MEDTIVELYCIQCECDTLHTKADNDGDDAFFDFTYECRSCRFWFESDGEEEIKR